MCNTKQKELSRPKCGEIWMCDLSEGNGSVQYGYRPVFILSNDKNNTYSSTINVIPITSKINKRKLPVHVELWNHEKYGLRAPSVLMIEQITTITLDCVDKYVGKIVDKCVLNDITRAIKIQFPVLSA